jgi:hypothetical protein
MAKNDFPKPTTKNSPAIHTGANRDNKSADFYTGFNYPTGGGNDIGVYKQPQPNTTSAKEDVIQKPGNGMDELNISVAGAAKRNYPKENKNGELTMRGYGAAIKGIKTRGPMA